MVGYGSRLSQGEWAESAVSNAGRRITERSERTAQSYRRFGCHACGKQFNERSETVLNRAQYPSDLIALVVLWRLGYGSSRVRMCDTEPAPV